MAKRNALTSLIPVFALLLSTSARAGVGEGSLLVREGKAVAVVPLEHTSVRIKVAAYVADVSVSQTFANPYEHKIEAIYAFPLPGGAAVDRLTLETGDQLIRGSLKRRAEARAVYRSARALGKVASLLEEQGGGLFTQSIANIEPGARLKVELHYVQELARDEDTYELVFPMVATPRPLAGANGANGGNGAQAALRFLPPEVRSSHDIDVSVALEAGLEIHDLASPSHRVGIKQASPSSATVDLAPDDRIPNKDFILRYSLAGEQTQAALIAHRGGREIERGTDGAFMLVISPPKSGAPVAIGPREIVFALDTSSSMRGAPLTKAKAVIERALSSLGPDDTFQVIAFSDHPVVLAEAPIANRPNNLKLAREWLSGVGAEGGTEMISAVKAALDSAHDPQRLRIVVFLTDGWVGDDEVILRTVKAHLGPSRLFPFGVGSVVNRSLLEEMAALGRGAATVVRPDEDEDKAVRRFYARIDRPILTDISIDWGGLAVRGVVPDKIPDLFAGQPLAILGRYPRGDSGDVMVSGVSAGARIEIPVRVELPEGDAENSGISVLWAKARIRELSRRMVGALGSEREDNAETITRLALEHGVLTPYTAFVAVSDRLTHPGILRTVPVPLEVPETLSAIAPVGSGFGIGSIGIGSIGTVGHGYGTGSGGSHLAFSAPMSMMMSHAAEAPTVSAGQTIVLGSIDKSLISRVLANHRAAIRFCYEKALTRDPTTGGRFTVHFEIDGSGSVVSAKINGSTTQDKELEGCVLTRMKSLTFPSVPGGGSIVVNMPYVFERSE